MLIALVVSLIFTGSAGGSIFRIPNFDKLVKKHIEDKERVKQILEYASSFEDQNKSKLKNRKSKVKEFWKLSADYSTDRSELNTFLVDNQKIYLNMYLENVENEIAIKTLIEEQEWQKILKSNDESMVKLENNLEKVKTKYLKALENLMFTIREVIPDQERINNLEVIIIHHGEEQLRITSELQKFNYRDNDILRNLESNEEENTDLVNQMYQIRRKYFLHFLETRYSLAALVIEDEWDHVIDKFNKLY